jgi:hypothetical protein
VPSAAHDGTFRTSAPELGAARGLRRRRRSGKEAALPFGPHPRQPRTCAATNSPSRVRRRLDDCSHCGFEFWERGRGSGRASAAPLPVGRGVQGRARAPHVCSLRSRVEALARPARSAGTSPTLAPQGTLAPSCPLGEPGNLTRSHGPWNTNRGGEGCPLRADNQVVANWRSRGERSMPKRFSGAIAKPSPPAHRPAHDLHGRLCPRPQLERIAPHIENIQCFERAKQCQADAA